MAKVLDELVAQLALERIEENLFRGQSQDLGWGTVFGGQVLGQALSAAGQTVAAGRVPHSLNAYFLRPGDVDKPIVYEVDRIRDGGSFTTRRVVAIQSGRAIFNMAASFQRLEQGFEHQVPMPSAPDPLSVPTEQEGWLAHSAELSPSLRIQAVADNPIEQRPIDTQEDLYAPRAAPPMRRVWMRAVDKLPDDPMVHAAILAYASDFSLLLTALRPHGVTIWTDAMQVASIDHVMWFHRPCRMDDWLFYEMDSPSAQGARGLARGSIFTRSGVLVASTAQEGLIRMRDQG